MCTHIFGYTTDIADIPLLVSPATAAIPPTSDSFSFFLQHDVQF
jgi:hypothetical protein